MQEFNYVDRSFSKDASGTYNLSVQANQHGLAYCIFDNGADQYVYFRTHRFENVQLAEDLNDRIAEILDKDDTLGLPYKVVRFLGYTQQSTLVPASFFSRDKLLDYLSFNHAGDVDHELFSNHIMPPDIYNVFALPREMVSLISLHFKKVEFLNQATPFLSHIATVHGAFSNPAVYVGLNTGFFDLASTGEGTFKLYNTFPYVNESDLLYYVLYAYKQLALDTQKVPLYISGEQCSKLSYFEILKQYIPAAGFIAGQGVPALAPGLYQLNVAKFFNLLNLQSCALSEEYTGAEK
jgi:hypothetical protein